MSEHKVSHDSETPAHGQQVITACAFIHHNFDGTKKLFLAKRADTKKFLPGAYELPGGHIDYGENIITGLKREIQEELHMECNLGDVFAAFDYHNEVKGSHSVEVIYFGKFIDDIESVQLNEEDHSGYGWFAESELDSISTEAKGTNGDPEWQAVKRGFQLLNNQTLNLG